MAEDEQTKETKEEKSKLETEEKVEEKTKKVTEGQEGSDPKATSPENSKLKEAIGDTNEKPKELLNKMIKKDTRRKDRATMEKERMKELLDSWVPKTKLGKDVKSGKIKNIDEILDKGMKILEPEIIDTLLDVKTDLISIGQSKGKFGGGKRRAWRQTQRKTKEGNVPTFSAFAVVGDENGHVGIGIGKSMETLPARDKAIRKAKLNLIKVVRGDGSFDSVGEGNTSIPYKIEGKGGSIRVTLIPAAPGTGLVVGDQLKKILKMAGIKDVYSKTSGRIRTTFNLVKACIDALNKTNPEGGRK